MKRSAILLIFTLAFLTAGIASAQEGQLSLGAIGAFSNTSTGKGLQEKATKAGGVLVSWRYYPHESNGLEVNYAFTKNTQRYTDASGSELTSVQADMHEWSVAYVRRFFSKGPIQPFALGGGGLVIFSPTEHAIKYADPDVSRKTRIGFLFGAGVDAKVTKDLMIRGQIRGLIYEAPDFYGDQFALHTSAAMRTLEPSVGIVYHF